MLPQSEMHRQLLANEPKSSSCQVFSVSFTHDRFEAVSHVPSSVFDAGSYSQFKYGRRDVAERYGIELADLVQAQFAASVQSDEPIVVTGTPCKQLPNAARLLAITVARGLRLAGLPVLLSSIYQHQLAAGDYGHLSLAERDARNCQKQRFLNREDFAGKHVVLVDDIRITGSIERSVTAMLADIPVLSLMTANVVRLDPEAARGNPQLENLLNHSAIHSVHDLPELFDSPENFTLITRCVKFILEAKPADIWRLLDQLKPWRIVELYEAVVSEGYDQMPQYTLSASIITDARNQIVV